MAIKSTNSNVKRKTKSKRIKYEEDVERITKDEKEHPTKYAKKSREYYHKNEEYRKYKQKYAKAYRKREPIKSRATKDRPKIGSK